VFGGPGPVFDIFVAVDDEPGPGLADGDSLYVAPHSGHRQVWKLGLLNPELSSPCNWQYEGDDDVQDGYGQSIVCIPSSSELLID
jgi:hypothetical protein